jgi:hypothetical protein
MVRIPHCLDNRLIDGGKAVSHTHPPQVKLPLHITGLKSYRCSPSRHSLIKQILFWTFYFILSFLCSSRVSCFILIKQKIDEKRRIRRDWNRLRKPESKRLFNTATQTLKELLNNNKNNCIQTFLQGLTPTEFTDYSLWKATRKKKLHYFRTSHGTLQEATSKKHTLFTHVFHPHPSENETEEEEALIQHLETPCQLNYQLTVSKELKFKKLSTA